MPKHDQRFKVMLRAMFPEFMELFFPEKAALLDLTKIEWLDKELFLDPPQGEKRELDLVAKTPRKPPFVVDGAEQIILVHVEVEADDRATELDVRFPDYYWFLRRKYGHNVLPIAVFLKVGLDGIGVRECEARSLDEWVMKFRYWYIGLPALDAEEYLQSENWLGVGLSSLMKAKPGERVRLAIGALDRLLEYHGDTHKQLLLVECLQAYAPLEGDERVELASLLKNPEHSEANAMIKTVYEEGLEQGLRAAHLLLERALQRRFGPLTKVARDRLLASTPEALEQLADKIDSAHSLKELGLED